MPALKKHSRWLPHHIQVALITCTQVLLLKYSRCQLFIKYPFTRGNLVYQLHRLKLLEWKITADLGSKAVTEGLAWCAGFRGGGGDGSLIRPLVSIITGNIHVNITANPEMNHCEALICPLGTYSLSWSEQILYRKFHNVILGNHFLFPTSTYTNICSATRTNWTRTSQYFLRLLLLVYSGFLASDLAFNRNLYTTMSTYFKFTEPVLPYMTDVWFFFYIFWTIS